MFAVLLVADLLLQTEPVADQLDDHREQRRLVEPWRRPGDTLGAAFVVSGISRANQKLLEAGGTDMLDGDGALNYGWEKLLETYYDFAVRKSVHAAADFQFIDDRAFNGDRGPVEVVGGRFHWEY